MVTLDDDVAVEGDRLRMGTISVSRVADMEGVADQSRRFSRRAV